MKELYTQYFENIFSPESNQGDNALSLSQVILLSWPFVIIKFFIEFVLTYFFLDQMAKGLLLEGDFQNLYQMFSSNSLQYGFLILFASSFMTMLFFPLWGFLAYLFWKVILNFYFWATKIDDPDGKLTEEIVCAGFSGYVFYLIPVIGELSTTIARLVILFLALRRRLEISGLAAFFILLTPPLFFGIMLVGLGILIQFLTIS